MRRLTVHLKRLARDRRAATAVEYGFIVSLIVIAIIAAVQGLASQTTGTWNNVATKVKDVT